MQDCFIVRRGGGANTRIRPNFLKGLLCYPTVSHIDTLIGDIVYDLQIGEDIVCSAGKNYICILIQNIGTQDVNLILKDSNENIIDTITAHYSGESYTDISYTNTNQTLSYTSYGFNFWFIPCDFEQQTNLRVEAENKDVKPNIVLWYNKNSNKENFVISQANETVLTNNGRTYAKRNNGEAIGLVYCNQSGYGCFTCMSENRNAVVLYCINYNSETDGSILGPYTHNDKQYYIGHIPNLLSMPVITSTKKQNEDWYNHISCGKIHENEIIRLLYKITDTFIVE